MDEHMAFYNDKAKEDYSLLGEIEEFIKALQEESVSEYLEKAASNHSNNCTLYGYVARNIDGSLYLFEVEPKRIEDKWWDRDYHSAIVDNEAFPELKWEDAPIYVRLVIFKEG